MCFEVELLFLPILYSALLVRLKLGCGVGCFCFVLLLIYITNWIGVLCQT